jgi:epoxyqueuosine reductase
MIAIMDLIKKPSLQLSKTELLASRIKQWALELGFQGVGISDTNLSAAELKLLDWLKNGHNGEMKWMQYHGDKRSQPAKLLANTTRIISVRLNYLPEENTNPNEILDDNIKAYISRYSLGRDYHKLMRMRLQKLADKINNDIGNFTYRAFVDSAPVLEKTIAEKAGLGWIGKHSNLINQDHGSWFFLGELYTNLDLPVDSPVKNHCGSCSSCIDLCPTKAIIAPYTVDARRCISYLTIELKGSIPVEYRSMIGNRIYGCDDCQLVCPWTRFSQHTNESDFNPRHQLNAIELVTLFKWTEQQFLTNTEGMAIRRIGYESWSRNIAVALGNATQSELIINSLLSRQNDHSAIVREHVRWALKNIKSI